MELKGIHHMSAITANAKKNLEFYTDVLGLRLVKKTVNQDDTSIYHLFYGDGKGNPGTELTFFEISFAAANSNGVNSISTTSLRVRNDDALTYWKERFTKMKVDHEPIKERAGRLTLAFTDPEGQRLMLVSDEDDQGVAGGTPWEKSTVPQEVGIIGLGPIYLTVQRAETTANMLTNILGFRKKGTYPSHVADQPDIIVYETGEGGTGAEVHLEERKDLSPERLGAGGVHHIAFRVKDEKELREWVNYLQTKRVATSGYIDRFYFRSLYFREPNGILFELATDGPGFDTDEPLDRLGESLSLPPFLEQQRAEIEKQLKPLDTTK